MQTWIKGKTGDFFVLLITKFLGKNYKCFNNYTFNDGEKTVQIDHLIVSPYGIFVVETKNYSGTIYGNDNSDKFIQYAGNEKHEFYSPIKQNKGHIFSLNKVLGNFKYISIIVFSGHSKLNVESETFVGYIGKINRYIKKFKDTVIAPNEVELICQKIKNTALTGFKIQRQHVKDIQQRMQTYEQKIINNICPKCGGNLTLRKAQYGEFYGCSNYPKLQIYSQKMKLSLVVDMYGCPNRCKHCWLGHMQNKKMKEESDLFIVNYFKPYFDQIAYYSWVREPDFCEHYTERWARDNDISVNAKPLRFELASFYRLVRDKNYVGFLKETGTKAVQLTFFGLGKMTDKYTGRKGAFEELLNATQILVENKISPRWQAFINEENKQEVAALLPLIKNLRLEERCLEFGGSFKFFAHAGSCDGENYKLYHLRINKDNIPAQLIPYYLDYEKTATEQELCAKLKNDNSNLEFEKSGDTVLNISNRFDVYFNYASMSEKWTLGNMLTLSPSQMMENIKTRNVFAINVSKEITISQLVEKYGDTSSQKIFFEEDYKFYLLLRHLDALS